MFINDDTTLCAIIKYNKMRSVIEALRVPSSPAMYEIGFFSGKNMFLAGIEWALTCWKQIFVLSM